MFNVQIWDYSQDTETLEKLINKIRESKRIVVAVDPNQKGGVVLVGPDNLVNIREAEAIKDVLNEFHYGGDL